MNVSPAVIFLAICVLHGAKALITVTFDGDLKPCANGLQRLGWDLSNFDILMMDNENITLDGKWTFSSAYNNPLLVKVTLKRWVEISKIWTVMATRIIPNFCDVVKAPNEMWSGIVSHMKQRECPYHAGYTETFDKANIGNLAKSLNIPPHLLGPWRVFIEITTNRDGATVTECTMAELMLEDV